MNGNFWASNEHFDGWICELLGEYILEQFDEILNEKMK